MNTYRIDPAHEVNPVIERALVEYVKSSKNIEELTKYQPLAALASKLGVRYGLLSDELSFKVPYFSTSLPKNRYVGYGMIDRLTWDVTSHARVRPDILAHIIKSID